MAYHSRWEFELAIDEIKSHQSVPLTRPFAPRKLLVSCRRSTVCS